ncbi:Wzz/FepE/Etk N-terminal domain-containing protein [Microbacterium ureisolvens]|uniref:Wzz/FepE/Etk N-terminal domain-containing protein n=1 Tax=Microbacterium ureisolvens TaxID=2781186 RepID=UPI00363954D7
MPDHWTLEDLYTGVARSWWVLAVTVAAFIAAGAGAWVVVPQTYTATAQHTVEPISILSSGSSFSTVNMETERLVATSAAVLKRAARDLDDASAADLREATAVQVPRGSQVLSFEVTTASAQRSAEWATAVASAYGAMRAQNARDVVEQTTAELSRSTAQLQALYDSQVPGSDARAATEQQLDALREQQARLEATPFFPGTLVTPGTAPTDSNRPGLALFVAGGLFLGLLAGAIAALVVTRARSGPALAYRRDRRDGHAGESLDREAGNPPPLRAVSDDQRPVGDPVPAGSEQNIDVGQERSPILARTIRR